MKKVIKILRFDKIAISVSLFQLEKLNQQDFFHLMMRFEQFESLNETYKLKPPFQFLIFDWTLALLR